VHDEVDRGRHRGWTSAGPVASLGDQRQRAHLGRIIGVGAIDEAWERGRGLAGGIAD
jgi:hypothetical protein